MPSIWAPTSHLYSWNANLTSRTKANSSTSQPDHSLIGALTPSTSDRLSSAHQRESDMEEKPGVLLARPVAAVAARISIAAGIMLVSLGSCLPTRALATEPVRQGQDSSLIRAVFADRYLWLLSDAGELSAIEDTGDDRVTQNLSEPVLDLCVSDGHPMALTGSNGPAWTLRRWTNRTWSTVAVIPSAGDRFVSINCAGVTLSLPFVAFRSRVFR